MARGKARGGGAIAQGLRYGNFFLRAGSPGRHQLDERVDFMECALSLSLSCMESCSCPKLIGGDSCTVPFPATVWLASQAVGLFPLPFRCSEDGKITKIAMGEDSPGFPSSSRLGRTFPDTFPGPGSVFNLFRACENLFRGWSGYRCLVGVGQF